MEAKLNFSTQVVPEAAEVIWVAFHVQSKGLSQTCVLLKLFSPRLNMKCDHKRERKGNQRMHVKSAWDAPGSVHRERCLQVVCTTFFKAGRTPHVTPDGLWTQVLPDFLIIITYFHILAHR